MARIAELVVGGVAYDAWTDVRVTRSMDSLADTFEFSFVDTWSDGFASWPISEGDPCQVVLDGTTIIDGYVDDWEAVADAEQTRMRAVGRSRTGDLVDCSSEHKPSHWREASMFQIVTDICAPFDISPILIGSNADSEKKFRRFAIEDGESCNDTITRAVRARGFVAVAEADGLVVQQAGAEQMREPLVRPGNILSGGRFGSWRERFDRYLFRGQSQATDDWNGAAPAQLKGEVRDPFVTRYRPLRVIADTQGDRKDLGRSALRERNTRAGKSRRLTYVVHGWRNGLGEIWTTNARVQVDDEFSRIEGEFLIAQVTFSLGNDGELAELSLVDPRTFDLSDDEVAA